MLEFYGQCHIHTIAVLQVNIQKSQGLTSQDAEQKRPDRMSQPTSQDTKDTAQFDKIGDQWWDRNGPMAPLHHFTPVRVQFILDMIARYGLRQSASDDLSGLRILDIGCGGGLLAEPFARLGADVTAIDASKAAIAAAKIHATEQGLGITYRACLSEALAQEGHKFDVIYSSEVIEHVASRRPFIRAIADMLAPDGLVAITTINRTLAALATVKIGAEYITGQIPKGTHDYHKFVTPDELQSEFRAQNIMLDHITGFVPSVRGGFRTSSFTGVNYAAAGQFS